MKRCCSCGDLMLDGRKHAYCRACHAKYMRKWRAKQRRALRDLRQMVAESQRILSGFRRPG
jgi:hypothetical protein